VPRGADPAPGDDPGRQVQRAHLLFHAGSNPFITSRADGPESGAKSGGLPVPVLTARRDAERRRGPCGKPLEAPNQRLGWRGRTTVIARTTSHGERSRGGRHSPMGVRQKSSLGTAEARATPADQPAIDVTGLPLMP
jgi:hypothetical protein